MFSHTDSSRLYWLASLFLYVFLFRVTIVHAENVTIDPAGDWVSKIETLSPGDIAILLPGRYIGQHSITLLGTKDAPITIRGAIHWTSIFDGEMGGQALQLERSAYVVVERVVFTNLSPYGWDLDARKKEFEYFSSAREKLAEGLIINRSEHITIRDSIFSDIATRGIYIASSHANVIEGNLFFRIGDDTAGGDLGANSGTSSNTVRGNIFAGNVDGVVHHGAGTDHLIENNLFLNHQFENNLDIKFHSPGGSENPWSTISHNVFYANHAEYSGVEIQDSSDNIRVEFNVIHGARTYGLQIRGRSGLMENIDIVGNWFDAMSAETGINIRSDTTNPADVQNVRIVHNVFTGYTLESIHIAHGGPITIFNNIFDNAVPDISTDGVLGRSNLYTESTWDEDSAPISGTPIYDTSPVGPLAADSPGFNEATIIEELGYPHIGLPAAAGDLPGLECDIVRRLLTVFPVEKIAEIYSQGGQSMPICPNNGQECTDIGLCCKGDTMCPGEKRVTTDCAHCCVGGLMCLPPDDIVSDGGMPNGAIQGGSGCDCNLVATGDAPHSKGWWFIALVIFQLIYLRQRTD